MTYETKKKLIKAVVGGFIAIIVSVASIFGVNVLSSCSTTGSVNSEWDIKAERLSYEQGEQGNINSCL